MTVTLEAADSVPPTTTCLDVVRRAARLLGIVSSGAVPTGTDAATLLEYMQGVIDDLPALTRGEWTDVVLDTATAYEANDGDRIILDGVDPAITLPSTWQDDNGDDVLQIDLARVNVIGTGVYVWSSSRGAWALVTDLALSDSFPFGGEDVPGIAALIACAAADEYGAQLSPFTIERAAAQRHKMRSRFYRSTAARAPGVFY